MLPRRYYSHRSIPVVLFNQKKGERRKSLFEVLPSIHGTMLSITVGLFGLFALFAYQKINTQIDLLASYQYQISQELKPTLMTNINDIAFLDSTGNIDLPSVRRRFWEIAGVPRSLDRSKEIPEQWRGYNNDEYLDSACFDLFGLIELVSRSYPYYGGNNLDAILSKKWDIEKDWIDELIRFNTYFDIYWKTNQASIQDLLIRFRDLDIQRQVRLKEETANRVIASRNESGLPTSSEEINKMLNFTPIIVIENYRHVEAFFIKVDFIQKNLVPEIRECRTLLNMYKNEFKLRSRSRVLLLIALFVFILGIVLPVFGGVFFTEKIKYRMQIEVTASILTLLPYIVGLVYLVIVVSRLHLP